MVEPVPIGAGGGQVVPTSGRMRDELHRLLALVPARLVPTVVRRRLDRLWQLPEFREGAAAQMRYLLEFTERAHEAEALARGYAEQVLLRSYLRWHPRVIGRQRVRDVEWLTTRRDPARGAILSFMHHGHYNGLFPSLHRVGVEMTIVMSPSIMGAGTAAEFRQAQRMMTRDVPYIPSTVGSDALVERLQGGATLVVASDVPSRTPVTFLGRRALGALGAARLATVSDSPIILVTTWRDADGTFLQVDPPIDPRDFADAHALLAAVLDRHGQAVLAWPEALEMPRARFAPLPEPAS